MTIIMSILNLIKSFIAKVGREGSIHGDGDIVRLLQYIMLFLYFHSNVQLIRTMSFNK